jgi:hypothetical protein
VLPSGPFLGRTTRNRLGKIASDLGNRAARESLNSEHAGFCYYIEF